MWKLIVTVLIVVVIYSHCAKFGDDNSYTCHCIKDEQCNKDTGVCSGGCATGWSGPSCQKQNVARGKPSIQVAFLGEHTSNLAVDGNRTTTVPDKCSDTGDDETVRWWRVDLEQEYPIYHITIYYRNELYWIPKSLYGFSLHVNKENQEPELCYKDKTNNIQRENNIECSQVITGRYVNISNVHPDRFFRFLTLCEVEIYVCSVGTFGSNCTNFCHCLNNERCSETGECPGGCADGWTGTTCSQKCVDGLYGDDCQKMCGNRKCLNNSSCGHVGGVCNGGCSDGYILQDCSKACDNGKYGAECVKHCSDRNCLSETTTCNHINGSCQGDCKEGFVGIDCVKGCEEGVYGAGCSKKCSDRKCKDNNLQCDSKTGECIAGCQPGYQSIDCTQECNNGMYGQDCKFNCSARFCQSQDECRYIDGACDCLDGYGGTTCTVKKATVSSGKANTGSNDQIWIIIGTILGLIIGFVAGALVVLFIMKRRLRSEANKSQNITSHQSDNNITQQETIIDQPVTQPSSNVNQDNPYGQLNTIYQNEHAYAHLGQI